MTVWALSASWQLCPPLLREKKNHGDAMVRHALGIDMINMIDLLRSRQTETFSVESCEAIHVRQSESHKVACAPN